VCPDINDLAALINCLQSAVQSDGTGQYMLFGADLFPQALELVRYIDPTATYIRIDQIGSDPLVQPGSTDVHVIGSAALFNTVYPGYQVETVDDSTPIGITRLVNGRALSRGLETEVAWRPESQTTVSLAAAYIQALVTNLGGASCYPTQTPAEGCIEGVQNESGHPLPDSPKVKLNGEVAQRVPFGRVDAVFGGTLSYQTGTLFQFSGNPETYQPGFALLNLSAAIESKDSARSLKLFVNNVTNHFYLVDSEDFFSGSVGFSPTAGGNYVVGQPARDAHRYFGASVSIRQ